MRIAKREDFSLIFMKILAKEYSGDFLSISHIARKAHLSPLFMRHMALRLKKKGLVESKEGIGGGYRLAKAPEKITLREILESISKKLITTPCLSGFCRINEEKKSGCGCSELWEKANKNLTSYFDRITLSEFINY